MPNILPRFLRRSPTLPTTRSRLHEEARWSARTPCPTCGAFCLRALDGFDMRNQGVVPAYCVWCELPLNVKGTR